MPPGTRKSTYANRELPEGGAVRDARCTRRSRPPTCTTRRAQPVPYTGIQYVAIPEFQAIGTHGRPAGRRRAHRPVQRRHGAEAGAGAGDAAMEQAGYCNSAHQAHRRRPRPCGHGAAEVTWTAPRPRRRHRSLPAGRPICELPPGRPGQHPAAGGALGRAAAGVVAGAAGDDAVVLVPALQPAQPADRRLRRHQQLQVPVAATRRCIRRW